MQHAQTTLGEQSSTYVIPSEAYGKNLRGWRRWLLLFAEYSSLMFSAQVLFDIFFAKRAVISNFSVNWTHDTFFSMFWGAGMALFAVTTRSALSGLEIRSDSIVLYEGEALDPLYQIGRGSGFRDSGCKRSRRCLVYTAWGPDCEIRPRHSRLWSEAVLHPVPYA